MLRHDLPDNMRTLRDMVLYARTIHGVHLRQIAQFVPEERQEDLAILIATLEDSLENGLHAIAHPGVQLPDANRHRASARITRVKDDIINLLRKYPDMPLAPKTIRSSLRLTQYEWARGIVELMELKIVSRRGTGHTAEYQLTDNYLRSCA